VTYGSAQQPVNWGSGGSAGWQWTTAGGEGGGAIRFTVGGSLTVNGRISAGGDAALQDDGGGGSGGSIWLTAGALAGNGAIAADGGAGQLYDGGGGGGGRVAIYAPLTSSLAWYRRRAPRVRPPAKTAPFTPPPPRPRRRSFPPPVERAPCQCRR